MVNSSDIWGCNDDLAKYPVAWAASMQCVRTSPFCDAPTNNMAYTAFRPGCSTTANSWKYLGSECPGSTKCATAEYGRCGSGSSQSRSANSTDYPGCEDDVDASLFVFVRLLILCHVPS